MRKLSFSWSFVLGMFVAVLLVVPMARGGRRHMRKYKPPPPMASVTVTVVHGDDARPLKNAAVVFHTQTDEGKTDGNMELKTNADGKATLTIVPIGARLLVQVIAPGFRTFGKEYDVPSATKSIQVKLLPPDQQYSIYEKNRINSDIQTNTPQTQMGHAAPSDSPLLTPPTKKNHSDE